MKLFKYLLLIALLGCDGTPANKKNSKNSLFGDIAFKPGGVSSERVKVGIKIQRDGTHYITTNSQGKFTLICAFQAADNSVADQVVRASRNGVNIVLREAIVDGKPDAELEDIFLSLDEANNLVTKTSEQLQNDSKTLVYARNVNTSNKEEAKSMCEFNLLDLPKSESNSENN